MNIAYENLARVKKSFEAWVERSNILESDYPFYDYPFYNAYVWLNQKPGKPEEILFSSGYRSFHLAAEMAETSNANPTIANAGENDVMWLGVLDASKVMIPTRR